MHREMFYSEQLEMAIVAAARLACTHGTSMELMRAYHEDGDLAARERLIETYLPLVVSIARTYMHRGERLEDLVQVGAIGLIKAVDRFEPERGVTLAAFAIPTIEGEVKRYLRDSCAPIRVPRRHQELSVRLRKERRRLRTKLQRDPTPAELAAAAHLHERDVDEAARADSARTPLSLVDSLPEEHEADAFDQSDDRLLVAAELRTLPRLEREALECRYFNELTHGETARRLGVSQTQASRLVASALTRLHRQLDESRFVNALGSP
jgi:RNA polymerase sigma-B factor